MAHRLIDFWKERSEQDPTAVVKAMCAQAPSGMLRKRNLTEVERKLWRRLRDRGQMGVDVFRHVPVYRPREGLERVMTFFVPRFALCVEVGVDMTVGSLDDVVDRMMEQGEKDELLREAAGIVTMRCPEDSVRKRPEAIAANIRWDLGLSDEPAGEPFDFPRGGVGR